MRWWEEREEKRKEGKALQAARTETGRWEGFMCEWIPLTPIFHSTNHNNNNTNASLKREREVVIDTVEEAYVRRSIGNNNNIAFPS